MIGRREFGLTGLSAIALAALEGSMLVESPQASGASQSDQHCEMLQDCAKACSECQRACDACSEHCAHQLQSGHKEHITTLATCQDCADFCASASQIAARGGPFAGLICQACAEACARCAKECEKFPNDEKMTKCAEECRKCEKACKDMVQHSDQSK